MIEMTKIELDLEYTKNILKVLDNHTSLCFEIVSQDIKDNVSDIMYRYFQDLFDKYHNANCGPFNRTLKKKIEDAKKGDGKNGQK